jgi:hypothetical protein
MKTCKHAITQGRDGEKGSWCCACGQKIYEVDARECRDCKHSSNATGIWSCRKHLMMISANMHVYYKITDGTCFEDRP